MLNSDGFGFGVMILTPAIIAGAIFFALGYFAGVHFNKQEMCEIQCQVIESRTQYQECVDGC